jgi:hypothetical protein
MPKVELFDLFSHCDTGYVPRVPEADLLMALHYLKRQCRTRLISDPNWKQRKVTELHKRPKGTLRRFLKKKPETVTDYPPHIRSLALYFQYKFQKKLGKWDWDKMPYSWKSEVEKK